MIEHQTITTQELRDQLDALAEAKLGVSAEEFMARYHAGTLELTSPTISELAVLAHLIDAAAGRRAA